MLEGNLVGWLVVLVATEKAVVYKIKRGIDKVDGKKLFPGTEVSEIGSVG